MLHALFSISYSTIRNFKAEILIYTEILRIYTLWKTVYNLNIIEPLIQQYPVGSQYEGTSKMVSEISMVALFQ